MKKIYFLGKNMSGKWKKMMEIWLGLSSDIYIYISEGKFLMKKENISEFI